jgi:hypothetical protein
MLDISTILKHYKREDIQKAIIEHSQDREAVARYDESFGSRPDVLKYPKDIIELAKQGATSFHASEELWNNPLRLDPMLKKQELDNLRKGWDLVLDIDCPEIEYSKIAADLLIKALKHHNIQSISVKFSGNKGFHIGVPFEAFPKQIKTTEVIDVKTYFPDGVRLIAQYLKDMIKDIFAKKVFEFESQNIEAIAKKCNKPIEEITKIENKIRQLDPEKILEIDSILISSRHLYRMPYSLHEKSSLVSIPIDPNKVLEFKKEQAKPENINLKFKFLDRKNVIKEEARELFDKAIYSSLIHKKQDEIKREEFAKEYEDLTQAIPEELFPPCIKAILRGLDDGKKRSLFILTNFLSSAGWDYEKIKQRLTEWNKKNKEPLREVLIVGHLRYHQQKQKKILPPNCSNNMYYKDMRICLPDNLCGRIKNPVQYSKRKAFALNRDKKPEKE